jgi:hypothetical protein
MEQVRRLLLNTTMNVSHGSVGRNKSLSLRLLNGAELLRKEARWSASIFRRSSSVPEGTLSINFDEALEIGTCSQTLENLPSLRGNVGG